MDLHQQRHDRKYKSMAHFDVKLRHSLRRRAEDVDYWRKQAGWYDDDENMKAYNNGVYDTFYNVDDDTYDWSQINPQNDGDSIDGEGNSDVMITTIKVVGVLAGICLLIYVFRLLTRRGESKKKDKKEKKKKSSSESRTRSKSRSRSRSRSRRGDYDLMEDKTNDSEGRSKRSSRSKSRSSRSRSRTRSRSKANSDSKTEAVLV